MPKFYRTMFEINGKPRIGDEFCELGVRPPGKMRPNGQPAVSDVDVDAKGNVLLNNKGMSVFRSHGDLNVLPRRLVPIHLAARVRVLLGRAVPAFGVWETGRLPRAW